MPLAYVASYTSLNIRVGTASRADLNELPHSIEAFFFIAGGCTDAYDGPKCEGYVRGAHRNFVAHFGLASDDIPLLRLDTRAWDQPFTAAAARRS